MTRRDLILKCAAYGGALILITVLNFSVLGQSASVLPLLLPMAAISAGILEGPRFAAGFGAAAGLLMNTAGHSSFACIALLSALGWVCGLLAEHALRRDLAGNALCAFGAMVLWELWQVLSRLVSGAAALGVLLRAALPEFLWTLALSFPVYGLLRLCCVSFGRIYHE